MPLFFYLFTFLLFYLFLHSHTGRSPQGGKDGRRHRGDDLHNPFDSFFLCHTRFVFIILARIPRINTALFYSAVSLKESRVNPCLKMVKVTNSIFLARKWKAQPPGLAPKCTSRLRLVSWTVARVIATLRAST